jgi:hypothetical protein
MMKIYIDSVKKTTVHNLLFNRNHVKSLLTFIFCFYFYSVTTAQQYINGNLSTGTLNSLGVVAPAGSSWSEVQLGNSTIGINATTGSFLAADNFYVCSNWSLTKFTFYAFVQDYLGTIAPTNSVRMAIYNTDPSVGAPSPVWGDLTANSGNFSTAYAANMYRVSNGVSDLTRQLWKVEVNTPSWNLTPGNYWIVFSIGNSQTGSASWIPLSTVANTVTQPGNNAKSKNIATGAWSNITDASSTTAQDLPFIINYTTAGACSGVPAPGATITSNAGPLCPSVNFDLSLSNPDCQSGVSYQWQYSTNGGGSWSNLTGATQSTLSGNFATFGIPNSFANVQFRANVTCSNGSSTAPSTAVTVQQNPLFNCYCTSQATSTADEDVTNVIIGSWNNSSTCSTVAPGTGSIQNRYANYTTGGIAVPTIFSGISNPFSVVISTCGGNYPNAIRIWIDLNHDGTLDNTTERVFSSAGYTNGPHTESGGLVIPITALTGQTLMRIANYESFSVANTACSNYTWGETEDYIINIQAATGCGTASINPSITNTVTSASSACPGVSFNLSLSTTFGYSGISYQWQSSPNGSTWTNITGATNPTYSTSLTSTTFYQCQILCSNTLLGVTNPVQVSLAPPTNCYCNSSANITIDEEIVNVTLGTMSNNSVCTQQAPGPGSITSRYSNFTTSVTPPNIFAGINNPFSVQVADCEGTGFYTSGVGIWIDFNIDGDFDDAGEQVFLSSAGINGNYTAAGNLLIPASASGVTRMRIVNKETTVMSSITPCGTYGYGETEDYLVNIVPAVSCSSTSITIGSTVSSVNSVCPNINFNLSLSNSFGYVGITYQWQSSSTLGGTYSNVTVGGTPNTSGTQSTYTTSLTATTFYQCQIFCNGSLLGTTTPVQVLLAAPTDCYCIPTANCASLDDILNVTIGSINNTTNDCVNSGYNSYVSSIAPATVYLGASNPISVTVNAGGQESAGAWIDYNYNGIFETTEFTFIGSGASSTTPLVFTNFINIPISATTGFVRMRVRSKYGTALIADNEACTPFTFGQTEDYLVNIQAATVCDNTFNPGTTISTANPVCPSVPFTLSFSNTSPTSGLQYQWQSSPNGTTWTDIPTATSLTYQTTQLVATYYRIKVLCQASAQTTYSTTLQITMSATSTCYCIPAASNCASLSITNVNFAGINNTSTCSNNGYINYSGTVAPGIAISGANNVITISGTGSRYTSVWIDYNRNGAFETTEYTNLGFSAAASVSGTIAIPTTALGGQTLMRVRVSNSNIGSGGPCTTITNGETEDYRLTIIACSAVSIEQFLSDQTTTCGGNASFNIQVSSSVSPNETFQWQVKTSPTGTWSNVINGPSGTATYAGANTGILSVSTAPLSFNGYEYRVYINGNCSRADTSNVAKLFVNTTNTTTITSQPQNASIGCANNASFSFAVTTGPNPVYQWQVRQNASSPWINLANGVNGSTTIAGVTTTTLNLTYVTNNFNGYQFRAYLSSPCAASDTTGFATLTVTPITANLTLTSNATNNTICNGDSATFNASLTFNGASNFSVTANNTSSGTTIFVSSTTNLSLGQYVAVNSGTGVFAPNTYITALNPGVSFTVNQAPTTPIASGAVVGAFVFGFKFYVNNVLMQNSSSNTYTSGVLVNGSQIRCTVGVNDPTSCVPVNPAQSNTITMTVTPNTPVSVAITSNLGASICNGENVTFTATPTNGGTNPTYQWKKNNSNIPGATLSTYSSSTLVNGDIITVVMTSNIASNFCGAPNPATSNAITMTVNQANPVSIVIAANPGVNICPGTSVTFTATPTNGGATPAYQWQLSTDGGATYNNVGTNSATYVNSSLNSNDKIRCILTSSVSACTQGTNPATSAVLTMSVSSQPFTVGLTANPSGTICQGTSVTYTASCNLNGGTPTYQFYVNGNPVANTTANTYAYTPAANDTITVSVIPDAGLYSCATPNPGTAGIRQAVNARPTVSISPVGSTCSPVGLNAVATNGTGASSITYNWQSGASSTGPWGATLSTASSYYTSTINWYQVTVTNNLGCTATSAAYQVASLPSGLMSGNYTIGAVSATNASSSGTTITCTSTAGLTVGQEIAVTSLSATGVFAAGTTVTAITSATTFTVSVSPTTALSAATITQASCINFISFAKAITALNTRSVGGNCVFNVSTDFNEYPTARLDLGAATLNTASSTYSITFQKSGSGANPLIRAYTGTSLASASAYDGIWALNGIDNVTIDGIDLLDGNTASPTTMMEYGYGLFRLTSTTDGAQNNTIKNSVVTLNKANNTASAAGSMPNGSTGILVNSGIVTAPNTAAGTGSITASNSNNKFYTNTIQNCYNGIVLTGFPSTTASTTQSDGDFGNDIGGSNASTGNTIRNFAGSSTNESNGIKATAQWNLNVSYNTINNASGGGSAATGVLIGINGVSGDRANVTINNNTINVTNGGSFSVIGISNTIGNSTSSNTVNINNNDITGGNASSSGANCNGILNNASCTNLNINGNNVHDMFLSNGVGISGGGSWMGINNNVVNCVNVSISGNTISNNIIYSSNISSASNGDAIRTAFVATNASINNNTITGNTRYATHGASATTNYIVLGSGTATASISNNTITNNTVYSISGITASTGFTLNVINTGTNTLVVSNNIVNNNGINMNVVGTAATNSMTVYGYISASMASETLFGNSFKNLYISSSNGSTSPALHTVYGIRLVGTATGVKYVYKNNIENLYTNSGFSSKIYGIYSSGGSGGIYQNKISNLFPGQSATTGSFATGITLGSHNAAALALNVLNLYNNMIALDLGASTRPVGAGANVVQSTASTEALRGIEALTAAANSNYNISYNTIRLAGTNATQFSSSGIFQTNSATATSAKMLLKNNIIVNECVPVGATSNNVVAAFKRSAAVGGTSNYDAASSNNAYYTGAFLTNRCIYFDGTSQFTTVPLSQTNSTVLGTAPSFASTTDLHMLCGDAGIANAGTPITTPISIGDDIDDDTRDASTPDIGADEFAAGSFAGAITANATVCAGANGTLNLTGYGTGATILTWQSSTDGGVTYNDISGTAGATSYNYTSITQTTKFIARVSYSCGGNVSTQTSDTATITVNPIPTLTANASGVCIGSTVNITTASSPALANPWVSSNSSIATVSTSGVVTGIAAGSATITFTSNTGCSNTISIPVNALPTAPSLTNGSRCGTGAVTLLEATPNSGNTIQWYNAPTGGTLQTTGTSFTTPSIAATTIYYAQAANSNGCTSTRTPDTAFVYTVPTITGASSVCIGSSSTLNITAGSAGNGSQTPIWASSNIGVATIDASGAVIGVASGSTNITYTNTNGCVSSNYAVAVNALPVVSLTSGGAGISNLQACQNGTVQLYGNGTVVSWTTSNTSIATVSNTGLVTTLAATGNCNITYNNGCTKTVIVTVNPKPTQYAVTGTGSYCSSGAGVAVGLSNSQAGVSYQLVLQSTSANVGSPVNGIGGAISFGTQPAGTYIVNATNLTTGCTNTMTGTAVVTAITAPPVNGISTLCIGSTTTLSSTDPPSTVNPWISSNNTVATIDDNNGLLTAVGAGTATITYTNSTGCSSVPFTVTVSPLSVGGTVTTDTSICIGQPLTRTLTLSGQVGAVIRWEFSTNGGGTWTTIANTSTTYTVSSAPAVTTQYRAVVQSVGQGCTVQNSSSATITVNPLPVVSGISINGGGSFCTGSNGVLVGLSGSTLGLDYQLVRNPSTNVGLPFAGTGAAFNFGYVATAGTYSAVGISVYGCTAPISGTVTVTPIALPVVTITQQSPINICFPSTQPLTTSTSGAVTSYQWYSYGTAIPSATASSYTVSGSGTNVITVQAFNSATGCYSLKSHAIVVNINTAPVNIITAPDTAEICTGGSQSISVSVQNASGNAVAMIEDFNDTANIDWSVYNAAYTPAASSWSLYSTPYNNAIGSATFLNFTTQDGGWFAEADADAGGPGSSTLSILYSDTFSLANYTSATLTFEHALRSSTLYDNFVQVDISTDAGNTWTLLRNYLNQTAGTTTSNAQTTVNASINLNSYLGQNNLMVRYYYDSDWGYYWLIDNVKVTGLKQYPTSFTWSPAAGLNTTTGAAVIASPAANTSYIVTATSSEGCIIKDTSVINIKPRPVISTEPTDTTLCLGDAAPTLSVVVVATGSSLSYQWYSNTANSNAGGTIISGAIADTLVPSVATTGIKYYYVVVTDIQCNIKDTSRAAAVTVNSNTTITTEPTAPAAVCIGGTAPILSVVASGTTLTYQWYSNTTSSNLGGTLIASATSSSYTVPIATSGTVYYYVIVSGRCGKDTSSAVAVVVNANTSITTQPLAPSAVCAGSSVAALTVVATGAGTLTYQWYSNTTNSNTGGTNLGASAQNSSYTPGSATVGTTYYYVIVTGSCGNVSSNAVAVVVNAVTTITAEPLSPAALCVGGAISPLTVTATGTGTLTYQWYSNTVNNITSGTSLGASAQTANYTPSVASAGTTYYYVIVTGTCGKDTSITATVAVTGNSGPLAAGTYYIPARSCSDFPSIAAAVSYLNTNGIANVPSGNWIFKVDSNYIETSTATIGLGTALINSGNNGVSATKRIAFRKNGTGNNPKIIAPTGTAASFNTANPDGIWSLRGIDYVTIDGIDLQDNNASGNAMMEYGYGLFKLSVTDGAQYDSIKNCVVTLNRNNIASGGSNVNTFDGSVGIAVVNGLATAASSNITIQSLAGANAYNKFTGNTIQNCHTGIGINGFDAATPAAFADVANSIGDSTVPGSGNTIVNFGGGTNAAVASYGVYMKNQIDAVIAYNNINNHANATGIDHANSQYGIATVNATGTTGIGIKNNNVTITGGANSIYCGISNNTGGGVGFAVNIINNNVVVKVPSIAITNTIGSVTGIYNSNGSAITTININGNTVKGSVVSGDGPWIGIQNLGAATGAGVINMNSNIIDSNSIQSTGSIVVLQNGGATYQTLNMNNNTISRNNKAVSSASTTDINWLHQNSQNGATVNIQNNLLEKDTVTVLNSNAAIVNASGIRIAGAINGNTISTNGNIIRKLSIQGMNSTFAANLKGYWSATALGSNPTEIVFGNKITNLFISAASGAQGAHSLYGIHTTASATSSTTTKNIYSNAVDTLYIRNNGDASPAYNAIVAAIYSQNGSTVNMYKNKIAHIIPFGTSGTTALGRGIWLGTIAASGNAYVYNNMINLDLNEAFDGASSGSTLTNSDAIKGIEIGYTATANTFLYFNTVRIAGSGNPSSGFGTSAVSLSSSSGPTLTLKNNILVNKSNPGSTGFAVAFRKSFVAPTYAAASSNNLFYVDTTGRRIMFYENTTAYNTLSGSWITGGRETNSLSQVEPVFVKAPDGTDSLHLNIHTNCAMNASGVVISSPSITDDIDGDIRGNGAPTPPDMGADEFNTDGLGVGQWAGINTNWNDAANWCGFVPAATTNVTITSGKPNYPVIKAVTAPIPVCNNLSITGGSVLDSTGGFIKIYGSLSNTGGTFDSRLGGVEFAGNAAQTIPVGFFLNDNLRNLTISNSNVTLAGKLNLLGKLGFSGSSRTFNIGDSLLNLKSSDTLTAYVSNITKDVNTAAVITGNTITGNAVVERYISSRKAWRLLSMPTTHNAQTIKMAWQEGAVDSSSNNRSGFGIQITSNLGTSASGSTWQTNGFDAFSLAGPSVKVYNPVTNVYDGILGTKSVTSPSAFDGKFVLGNAYMTFIRGDRSVRQVSQAATSTILREKGALQLNNFTVSGGLGTTGNQFVSVGNPYASAVEFKKLNFTNIDSVYHLWDPSLGTYGVFVAVQILNGNPVSNILGGSYASGNYNIQSGQGFFVHTNTAAGTMTFNENAKIDGSNLVSRTTSSNLSMLRNSLFRMQNNIPVITDGALSIFGNEFANDVDSRDAVKLNNMNENLFIQRNSKSLAIETKGELQASDTIFYQLNQLKLSNYRFEFAPENLAINGLTGYLEDAYLHNSTEVSLTDTTRIDFTVSNDPGSYATDRFRLVFRQLAPVPVTFVDVKAIKQNKDVNVIWTVENEININNYVVERAADGRTFAPIGNVMATRINAYTLIDHQPLFGNNFYRIKSIGIGGEIKYSKIVMVAFESNPSITLYPNPVGNDKTLHFYISEIPSGLYQVKVINSIGQMVMSTKFNHTGLNETHAVILNKDLAHGNYKVELTSVKGEKTIINFVY